MSRQIPINRHIPIQPRQYLLRTRGPAPIPHQIAHNREQRVHLHSGAGHLVVSRVAHELGGCARCFDVGVDGVAGGAQAEGEKGSADVGCYTGEDDLLLPCGLDGGAEGGVVPGAVRISVIWDMGKMGEMYFTSP